MEWSCRQTEMTVNLSGVAGRWFSDFSINSDAWIKTWPVAQGPSAGCPVRRPEFRRVAPGRQSPDRPVRRPISQAV
eukprot:COSAG02_NODE_58161_length_283_cov_0.748603_1_plen_75_part_01